MSAQYYGPPLAGAKRTRYILQRLAAAAAMDIASFKMIMRLNVRLSFRAHYHLPSLPGYSRILSDASLRLVF